MGSWNNQNGLPDPRDEEVPQLGKDPEEEPGRPDRPKAFRLVRPLRGEEIPKNPAPSGSVLAEVRGLVEMPRLTLEKKAPNHIQVGQPFRYELVVRNNGPWPARKVRLEDELPPGARWVGGDPPPVILGNTLTWTLMEVPPGKEIRVQVELQTTQAGTAQTRASMTVSVQSGLETPIDSGLAVSLTGPTSAAVGKQALFQIKIHNSGSRPAQGVVLRASLAPGLHHAQGREIEGKAGDLAPGASKNFKLPILARESGIHQLKVRVASQNRPEAMAQATLHVGKGVMVSQPQALRLMVRRDSDLSIEVANHLDHVVRDVVVLNTLPEGMDFVSASHNGLYRGENRTVHWVLAQMSPGQTQKLTMRVQGRNPGQVINRVVARTEKFPESKSLCQVQIDGLPDLAVKVVDRDDPLEVGKDTLYEIRILNQGTAEATGLNLVALVPENMKPGQAQGPASYRIEGQKVIFAPLAKLAPREETVFHVSVRALGHGQSRFRVQVFTDQARLPIFREENTWVYRE